VSLKLGTWVSVAELNESDFEEIILATGIVPRIPDIDGIDHKSVVSYIDVISGAVEIGQSVAIIGAGGIGFDVAELLSHEGKSGSLDIPTFMREWGVDMSLSARGGIEGVQADPQQTRREIYLLQRKTDGLGKNLGKTTGWIHRLGLVKRGVKMIPGCNYERIDDQGLHLTIDDKPQLLAVDQVVICAGQEPRRELTTGLHKPFHLIGGADVATELDAKRAIDQGTRLAASI
jgi:2,4-dienoyl-CoA reductase (NADPH2)